MIEFHDSILDLVTPFQLVSMTSFQAMVEVDKLGDTMLLKRCMSKDLSEACFWLRQQSRKHIGSSPSVESQSNSSINYDHSCWHMT